MTELIKQLSAEVDKETMLLSRRAQRKGGVRDVGIF